MHAVLKTLPAGTAASDLRKSEPTQVRRRPGTAFVLAMVAEYKRAAAATHRYHELKRTTSAGPCAARDIARQIYREYYVHDENIAV